MKRKASGGKSYWRTESQGKLEPREGGAASEADNAASRWTGQAVRLCTHKMASNYARQ